MPPSVTPEPKCNIILFVDDEKAIVDAFRRTLGRELKTLSLEFLGAMSVTEAKEKMAGEYRNRIALVVSDMHLGDGDGADVITAARENGAKKSILLSGALGMRPNDGERVEMAAPDQVLIKPLPSQELLAVIAQLLDINSPA